MSLVGVSLAGCVGGAMPVEDVGQTTGYNERRSSRSLTRKLSQMAKCDEGYLCDVCGEEVHGITDSDLYLRYVLNEVTAAELPGHPERHLRCNATLSQFIVDDRFEAVTAEGMFSKAELDSEFVAAEEARVSRGYRRLREVHRLRLPIDEYPLDD